MCVCEHEGMVTLECVVSGGCVFTREREGHMGVVVLGEMRYADAE